MSRRVSTSPGGSRRSARLTPPRLTKYLIAVFTEPPLANARWAAPGVGPRLDWPAGRRDASMLAGRAQRVPVAPRPRTRRLEDANDRPNPAGSVLVIEDNMDAADSIARFLRVAAGFEVKVAYDGRSPASRTTTIADPPTAVVCDISLPGLTACKSPAS